MKYFAAILVTVLFVAAGKLVAKEPTADDYEKLLHIMGSEVLKRVSPPFLKSRLGWHYKLDSPYTDEEQRKAKDPALVLKHLTEQTGLTFTKEKRKIRLLAIERKKDTGE